MGGQETAPFGRARLFGHARADGAAALLGGKSIGALLSIYTAQTGLYTGLTYNAPSFFALMNTTGLDVYAYGNFGMALAFGVCALLVSAGVKRAGRMTRAGYLCLALLLPLAIVFFLPRMHERYFYLADILSVALAAYDKKAAPSARWLCSRRLAVIGKRCSACPSVR